MRSVSKSIAAVIAAAVLGAMAGGCGPGATPTPSPTPTATPPETTPTPTVAATPTPAPAYEIRTVLEKDAIPAILDPRFLQGEAAHAQMRPNELVIGVSIGDDRRAYSTAQLSRHEVVNDTVGGRAIAVTW